MFSIAELQVFAKANPGFMLPFAVCGINISEVPYRGRVVCAMIDSDLSGTPIEAFLEHMEGEYVQREVYLSKEAEISEANDVWLKEFPVLTKLINKACDAHRSAIETEVRRRL